MHRFGVTNALFRSLAGTCCARGVRKMSVLSKPLKPSDVVILSAARTPIGIYQGSLKAYTGPELGAIAMKEVMKRAGITVDDVDEVFVGQALHAGAKQGPGRQAALKAGLPWSIIASTINKLCASSLKATMLGAQAILAGDQDVVVCAGQEAMSGSAYLLSNIRQQGAGYRLGHNVVYDGMLLDGLIDPFVNLHMGQCADKLAKKVGVSREQQDSYALESFKRAKAAIDAGWIQKEIVPIELRGSGNPKKIMTMDETLSKFDAKKVPTLKPAFTKDGTVTAANASPLNDAGSAVVLSSYRWAKEHGKQPIAVVRSFADAEQESTQFLTTPAFAIPKALKRIGLTNSDVDVFEINEAFAVAVIVCAQIMKIDMSKVNINGGAIVLGHPVGSSGARILGAALTALQRTDKTLAAVGLCNGGGGASAMVVERLK